MIRIRNYLIGVQKKVLHCICVAAIVLASPIALYALHTTSTFFNPACVLKWLLVLDTQPLDVFMGGWGSFLLVDNFLPFSSMATTSSSGAGSA